MKKHLLPQRKNSYKANMHCHSTWSDGELSPEELKEHYKRNGYSVLAITDHEGLFSHNYLDDEEFITIPGVEYEFNEENGPDYNDWIVCHLCAYKKDKSDIYQIGIDPDYHHPKFRWMNDESLKCLAKSKGEILKKDHTPEAINTAIKRLKDEGFIVTYNHPRWSLETYPVYSQYTGMNNLEIYNHGCYQAGFDDNNGDIYEDFLLKGERLFCVAADDNHNRRDMCGGFIMISADNLKYDEIISAFEKGEFYASRGPLIDEIYYENGEVFVKSKTPLKEVRFHTAHRRIRSVKSAEGQLFEAKFPLKESDKFIRAELIDKDGNIAYTQAYFTNDILGE